MLRPAVPNWGEVTVLPGMGPWTGVRKGGMAKGGTTSGVRGATLGGVGTEVEDGTGLGSAVCTARTEGEVEAGVEMGAHERMLRGDSGGEVSAISSSSSRSISSFSIEGGLRWEEWPVPWYNEMMGGRTDSLRGDSTIAGPEVRGERRGEEGSSSFSTLG